jgi:hypothetical protein
LQPKDRAKLAHYLEANGATVRKTRSGFIALNPVSKKTVSWHSSSSSDSARGAKNLRADVLKAGLAWPFDPTDKRKKVAA